MNELNNWSNIFFYTAGILITLIGIILLFSGKVDREKATAAVIYGLLLTKDDRKFSK